MQSPTRPGDPPQKSSRTNRSSRKKDKGRVYSKADLNEMDIFANRPRLTFGGNISMDDVTKHLKPKNIKDLKQDSDVLNELKRLNNKKRLAAANQDDTLLDATLNTKETEAAEGQYDMQEYNPAAKDQSENKAVFRKNYGYEQELPAVYVLDAKIFPLDVTFMIKIVKYVIPEEGLKIRTYPIGKESYDDTMKSIH